MSSNFLPAGTATGNADAVRAAPIANAFFFVANLMKGIDSQPRMEPGMTSSNGLIGPAQTLGVDFGIDSNGDAYVRGRAAADAAPPDNTATNGQPATDIKVPHTMMLVGLAFAVWVAYRLTR